ILLGRDPMAIPAAWSAMGQAVRNIGRRGVPSMAMAAVDVGLWDLKARLLDVSLRDLLGSTREGIPVYGSGGFTSYSIEQSERQFQSWIEAGIRFVKMKIGRDPEDDLRRVAAVRKSIGRNVGLFVDANGAYSVKQALCFAEHFADLGVTWFEEPVSSDN